MTAEQILYRPLETPVGTMIGGATARGLCLFEFADRGGLEGILAKISKRSGHEPVAGRHAVVDQLEEQVIAYFEGARRAFTVPLDLHGTPFQLSVWRQLLEIPWGQTCSYGDIARALGKPGGMRAVGRANGDNCVAIVVPCHRVIQSEGQLRGYGGGLWRKRRLLEHESALAREPSLPFGAKNA